MATGDTLMLIQKSSHALSFYDLATGEEKDRIGFPDYPHEFIVDGANEFAYVGHYGVHNSSIDGDGGNTIFVVNIAERLIVSKLNCGKHGRPHGIDMDAEGGLYVLSELSNRLLYKRNPQEGGQFDHGVPTGGEKSHLFALCRDGKRAFSMNLVSNDVTVFDPHDASVTPVSIRTGEKPEGRHLRADEKVLFVTNRISNTVSVVDTTSLTVSLEFATPDDPVRIYHDEKRDRLITANFGASNISIFDAKDGKELHRLEMPAAPIAASFDAGFDHVFVSVDCDQLKVVDLETAQVVRTLDTLKEPDVSYILPAGK